MGINLSKQMFKELFPDPDPSFRQLRDELESKLNDEWEMVMILDKYLMSIKNKPHLLRFLNQQSTKDRETPLMRAVRRNYFEVMSHIAAFCGNLEKQNIRKETALIIAVKLGRFKHVKLLMSAGAKFRFNEGGHWKSVKHYFTYTYDVGANAWKDMARLLKIKIGRCSKFVEGCHQYCKFDQKEEPQPEMYTAEFQLSARDMVELLFKDAFRNGYDLQNGTSLHGGGIKGLPQDVQLILFGDLVEEMCMIIFREQDCWAFFGMGKDEARRNGAFGLHNIFQFFGLCSVGAINGTAIAMKRTPRYCWGRLWSMKQFVFHGTMPFSTEPLREILKKEVAACGRETLMHELFTEKNFKRVETTVANASKTPPTAGRFASFDINDTNDEIEIRTREPGWLAVLLSCDAPTFLETKWQQKEKKYVDGGVFGSDPSPMAFVDQQALSETRVSSQGKRRIVTKVNIGFGTGTVPKIQANNKEYYGWGGLCRVLLDHNGMERAIDLIREAATDRGGLDTAIAKYWARSLGNDSFQFQFCYEGIEPESGRDMRKHLTMYSTNNELLLEGCFQAFEQWHSPANLKAARSAARLVVICYLAQLNLARLRNEGQRDKDVWQYRDVWQYQPDQTI